MSWEAFYRTHAYPGMTFMQVLSLFDDWNAVNRFRRAA